MRLVFLGPPGSGKGTQARELARGWRVPHIATGDMLREAAGTGMPLGLEARRYMDRGALVPDETVIGLVRERLARPDAAAGFILDGFPRTQAQAEALERMLDEEDRPLDAVVYLEVSGPELVRRLSARRTVEGRADDSDGAIPHRLAVYAQETAPLLAYYRARGLLATVPAEGTVETVRREIRQAVETPR
jgi:adenylate kinase